MMEKIKRNWLFIVLVVFSIIPLVWFVGKGNVIINGLDTNFPLDPIVWFTRRLFVWNDVASTGLNFASSTAGLFFHFVQVVPYVLGANLQITQMFSLIFWFSLLVFSAYYFSSKIFLGNKVSQLVFVSFYVFNIYLFNSWENVKVANLAVVTTLPLFLGIFISYINKDIKIDKLMMYTAVVGLIASGSGINPAYFIVIIGGLIIFGLIQKRIKILSLMVCIIFLVNSFWIVPTINHLLFSQNSATSLSDIGFTNWLDSLSENTSLLNVFRFQGAWDWYAEDDSGTPLYIPYASNYFHRLPFVIFSLIIPALAIIGFLINVKNKDKLKVFFGIMLILGLFLGSGTHSPTGDFYTFLTKYMPFFSFFRSPWYIFTPYLLLSTAALVSYIFLLENKILKYFAFILVIGNLIYTYPLVTGKIYRPQKSDSFFVKFPNYVFEAKQWLDDDRNNGRILSYPGDEIEKFEWGYRGIESILNLLSTRETIFSSLNDSTSSNSKLIKSLYLALQRNQIQIAESIAAKLNISTIFVKNDQSSLWDNIPRSLGKYDSKSIGEWNFYSIPDDKYLPKIYSPEKMYYVFPSNVPEEMLDVVSIKDSIVNFNDSIVNQISNKKELVGKIVLATNSQLDSFEQYQTSAQKQPLGFNDINHDQVKYSFEISDDALYEPVLESFMLDKFGIDWSTGLKVTVDGHEQIWKVKKDGDLIVFNDIRLSSGPHNVILNLDNKNLIKSGDKIIELKNREEKEKSFDFEINPFMSYYPYLIGFDYKNVYGRGSAFKIEQKNNTINYKFQSEGPPFSPEKIHFNFYFDPILVDDSYLIVKPVIMPVVDDSLGTKIEYSNISVYPIVTNRMFFVKNPEKIISIPRAITFDKISPVKYRGRVSGSTGSHLLVFSESYTKNWRIKLSNIDGSAINYTPLHFTANVFANAWFVEDMLDDYNFEVYYMPQIAYNVFLLVSIITFIFIVGYYIWNKYKVNENI